MEFATPDRTKEFATPDRNKKYATPGRTKEFATPDRTKEFATPDRTKEFQQTLTFIWRRLFCQRFFNKVGYSGCAPMSSP